MPIVCLPFDCGRSVPIQNARERLSNVLSESLQNDRDHRNTGNDRGACSIEPVLWRPTRPRG